MTKQAISKEVFEISAELKQVFNKLQDALGAEVGKLNVTEVDLEILKHAGTNLAFAKNIILAQINTILEPFEEKKTEKRFIVVVPIKIRAQFEDVYNVKALNKEEAIAKVEATLRNGEDDSKFYSRTEYDGHTVERPYVGWESDEKTHYEDIEAYEAK